MTSLAPACSNNSSLQSQREHSFYHRVCSTAGIWLLCLRSIATFSCAELLNVFLTDSLSLLIVVSKPEQIFNVIFIVRDKDFDFKLFVAQVHDLNFCRAISGSVVKSWEKSNARMLTSMIKAFIEIILYIFHTPTHNFVFLVQSNSFHDVRNTA